MGGTGGEKCKASVIPVEEDKPAEPSALPTGALAGSKPLTAMKVGDRLEVVIPGLGKMQLRDRAQRKSWRIHLQAINAGNLRRLATSTHHLVLRVVAVRSDLARPQRAQERHGLRPRGGRRATWHEAVLRRRGGPRGGRGAWRGRVLQVGPTRTLRWARHVPRVRAAGTLPQGLSTRRRRGWRGWRGRLQ